MNESVTATRYTCTRCGHVWVSILDRAPVKCPKCKSPYWQKPRGERPQAAKE